MKEELRRWQSSIERLRDSHAAEKERLKDSHAAETERLEASHAAETARLKAEAEKLAQGRTEGHQRQIEQMMEHHRQGLEDCKSIERATARLELELVRKKYQAILDDAFAKQEKDLQDVVRMGLGERESKGLQTRVGWYSTRPSTSDHVLRARSSPGVHSGAFPDSL